MKRLFLFTYFLFFGLYTFAQDLETESIEDVDLGLSTEQEDLGEGEIPSSLVVEQEYIAIKTTEHIEDAIPLYRQRRGRWGALFSVSYGLYSPENYQPDTGVTYASVYGTGSGPLFEITASKKMNLDIGSIVFGGGVGFFSADSLDGTRTLTVIPIRLEAAYIIDVFFKEPFISPYVVGGAYINSYKEEKTSSVDGNTQVAPYFGVGANFQLDWLDRKTALHAYLDYGIENTFLYIEGRSFISSSAEQDPDFSTGFQLAAGMKLEY